jgi:sulfite reductase beta subunit-like hemoprotein
MSELDIWIRQEDFDRLEGALDHCPSACPRPGLPLAECQRLGIRGRPGDQCWSVRARLPAARVQARQLPGLAAVLEHYSSSGVLRLTARQGLEIPETRPSQAPALLRHLALLGISTRDTVGNSLREMTICPMAGICPSEQVDLTPHLLQAARRLARNPLSHGLPRKLRVGFAGCGEACAAGTNDDIAVIATRRDGRRGFRLVAHGPAPGAPAVVLEELLAETALLPALEAAVAVYCGSLARGRAPRSRLDFLVHGFAAEGVLEAYRSERARRVAEFDPRGAPRGRWREAMHDRSTQGEAPLGALPQRQSGLFAVPAGLPHGELTASDLRRLHALLRRYALPELRLTPARDLLVPHVPRAEVHAVRQALDAMRAQAPCSSSTLPPERLRHAGSGTKQKTTV